MKTNLKIKSKTSNLKVIREFVYDFLNSNGVTEKEISDIILSVDEAATNIIKHAYKFDETKDIIIELNLCNNILEIKLIDFGSKFDPSKIHLPDIKESLKLKKAGGLGIYLMKKLMDEVLYDFSTKRQNAIILKKKITGAKSEKCF